MNNVTIKELCNHSVNTGDIFNVLLDNSEYSCIRGLLHINFKVQKAILFTDVNYDDINYELKWKLSNIVNVSYNMYYIKWENIHILNIPDLLYKLEKAKYNINMNLQYNIGINFKKIGFDIICNVNSGSYINIIEEIRNINIDNIKEKLGNSLISFLTNIKDYSNNNLNDILYDCFYGFYPNQAINLNNLNINFLNHLSKNKNLINEADSEINNFKNIIVSFLTYCQESGVKNSFYIKNSNAVQIQLYIHPKVYHDNALIFKFGDIKLTITDLIAIPNIIYRFIISNLLYLNEYNKLMAYFKNKLIQAL